MLSVYQADARFSSLKSDVVFWQRASRRVVVQGSSSCLRASSMDFGNLFNGHALTASRTSNEVEV
jgi:hypothetical protein